MEEQTIVTLVPNSEIRAVSFEEAFGGEDYSNASGKRAKRVQERQANKQAISTARAETKAVKQQNKGVKAVAKQQKKIVKHQAKAQSGVAKQQGKQDVRLAKVGKRTNVMAGRQQKRTIRKEMRNDRQQIGAAPEIPQEELTNAEYAEQELQDGGSDNTGYVEQSNTGQVDNSPIERDEPSDNSGDITNPYAQDEEAQSEEDVDDGYQAPDEYEDYFDANSSFEGVDESSLVPDNNFEFQGTRYPIHPKVRTCADKIEWNKEKVSRLVTTLPPDNSGLTGEQEEIVQEILNEIGVAKQRAQELEFQMQSYADASKTPEIRKKRSAEIKAALREARKKRTGIYLRSAKSKDRKATIVQSSLNPKIDGERIEIPASSNLVSEHAVESNLVSEHAVESNLVSEHYFSGNEAVNSVVHSSKIGYALIGVGLAALIIYGIKSYKK